MKKLSAVALASAVAIATAVFAPANLAVATRDSDAAESGTWAKRVAADPDTGLPTALTCLSKTFCVLADVFGALFVEQHGQWRPSHRLRPNLFVEDVSCASNTFCVATGQNGTVQTGFVMLYDGSTWTAPDFIAPTSVVGVSCVSTTFCLAVDYEAHSYIYDGTRWSPPQLIGDAYLDKVSCVSPTFCVAMDNLGGPWMFDGSTWTFYGYGGRYLGHDLECLSTDWCIIATSYGVRTWDGANWTYGDKFTRKPLLAVSCGSPTFCLAILQHGGVYRFDGSTWTSSQRVGETEPATVTCLADQTCYETGSKGYVYRYSAGSWPDRVLVDPQSGLPSSISCPTDDFCMVVDRYHSSATYREGRWEPVDRHPFFGATQISCASSELCVVGDDSSHAFVYRDGHWSKPKQFGIDRFSDVSCTNSEFCAAVTTSGYAVTYDGTAWSTPVKVLAYGGLVAVSCPSASFCMALKGSGGTMTYNGQGWHYAGDALNVPAAVSCSSPTFCIAISYFGRYTRWNGSAWATPADVGPDDNFDVACPVDGFCQALTEDNNVYTYSGGDWERTQQLGSIAKGRYTLLSCTVTVTCTAIDDHGWARRYS